jgi:hypothetical protein
LLLPSLPPLLLPIPLLQPPLVTSAFIMCCMPSLLTVLETFLLLLLLGVLATL